MGTKEEGKRGYILKPDLFTFVAEIAVERGDPIPVTYDCGSVITIMPPLQKDLVGCSGCESRIKLLVLSGDPGYVMGRAPNTEPMLIPVAVAASFCWPEKSPCGVEILLLLRTQATHEAFGNRDVRPDHARRKAELPDFLRG